MKDRDIRAAIRTLLEEGWITRSGTGPNGTNVYKVRMEGKRSRACSKPVAAARKSTTPLPPGGSPPPGAPPPPRGEAPGGSPLPPGGTPPWGETNKKPLNEEVDKAVEITAKPNGYMAQQRDGKSAGACQVTTADAVVTDHQIVIASDQNDAPQRHAEPAASASCSPATEQPTAQAAGQQDRLPVCARPHRQLLVEWWTRRRQKHPAAPRELSAADVQAIHHADALGVLEPFLEHAAASGCKSLATGYRRRCEQLRAGPAAAEAFEQLRSAYLAAPRRVTCQSLPAAQRELGAVLAAGHTVDQLLAALAGEVQAQEQQQATTGFAPSLPDMARWLKERRFVAYLPQNQPAAAVAAASFVPPIDPETGESDPFAYHRHITGR